MRVNSLRHWTVHANFRSIKRGLVTHEKYVMGAFLVCPKSGKQQLKGLGLKLKGLNGSLVRYELLIQRGSM